MNVGEIRKQIKKCREILDNIKSLTTIVKDSDFQLQLEQQYVSYNTPAEEIDESKAKEIENKFEALKQNLPQGLELDRNFIRHIGFNQVSDWIDIHDRDVDREVEKINDFEKNLTLVEKVEKLHPKIASTSTLLMIGDYDTALTKAFKSIETTIRNKSGIKDKIGTDLIGYVFSKNPPILQYKDSDRQKSVRNFLLGVTGFYRNTIMHDDLPAEQSNIDYCFQQLVIVSEAHKMIDDCQRQTA